MGMFFSFDEDETPEIRERSRQDNEIRKKAFNDGIVACQLIICQDLNINHDEKTRLWDKLANRKWK